jgi:hypothetical protein
MKWLKSLLVRWLLADFDARLKDVERHFVTKRHPETGLPIETLADVPLADRKPHIKPRGMSWNQKRAYLEATDGGKVQLG